MHVFFHASGIPDWPKISLSICKSRPQYSYRWECCDDTIKLSSTNSSTRLLYRGSPFRQLSWCVYVRFVVVHTQMDFTITNPTTQKWPDAQLASLRDSFVRSSFLNVEKSVYPSKTKENCTHSGNESCIIQSMNWWNEKMCFVVVIWLIVV